MEIITITPDNEMGCNVISSLTGSNFTLYDEPRPDNENQKNLIGEIIDHRFKWEMDINLTMEYPIEEDGDIPAIVKGALYMDGEYGYYTRDCTMCSTTYHSTFRFNKDKMQDVLLFIINETPQELEGFLQTLDGYEWIEQKHAYNYRTRQKLAESESHLNY